MIFDKIYYDRLPKFANILKASLSKKLIEKVNLDIEDHIRIVFDFYNLNSAYDYFKDFSVESDKMHFCIFLSSFESEIYINREIRIEDEDEEFEIKFNLVVNIPFVKNRIRKDFYIERNSSGYFSDSDDVCFNFEDFQKNVFSENDILSLLNLIPKSIDIHINADH